MLKDGQTKNPRFAGLKKNHFDFAGCFPERVTAEVTPDGIAAST